MNQAAATQMTGGRSNKETHKHATAASTWTEIATVDTGLLNISQKVGHDRRLTWSRDGSIDRSVIIPVRRSSFTR
jgi:hypothetical protein